MARQNGILKIAGTIDGITFYHSQDGSLLRKKTSLNKDRVSNDPRFLRTRENNEEFGNAATAGKLIRDTLRSLIFGTADNRLIPRLSKAMMKIKSFDNTSPRGKRNVAAGITHPAAQEVLQDFDFNTNSNLNTVLFSPFTLDKASGEITIPGFLPASGVMAPDGATHLSLVSAFAKVDFANGEGELQVSPTQNIALVATSTHVVLQPPAVPTLPGTSFYLLKITFFQLVNGVAYPLKNSSAMAILDIAP